jgi:Ca2+-binding EF-hand superfamily protein
MVIVVQTRAGCLDAANYHKHKSTMTTKFLYSAVIAFVLTAIISCKTTSNSTTAKTPAAAEGAFAKADRNHDGKLSPNEANDYFVTKIFEGCDQNHDGKLTWQEWNVPGSGQSKGRFDAADTDKDGSVSLAEAQAYGQKRGTFNKEFAEADTNHDGYVTPEEAQAYYASKEGPPN